MKDFFISYNGNDKQYAEWIAWTLEDVGFTTIIQGWDFKPGQNFVLEMQNASTTCRKTIAVLSNNYLSALFTQSEWATAFAMDPTGKERKLIPVRVTECEPPGILKTIIYCDLVDLSEEDAKARLLAATTNEERNKPIQLFNSPFKNKTTKTPIEPENSSYEQVKELLNLLGTTKATYLAQARLRNNLYQKAKERLKVAEPLQYEDFFRHYFNLLNTEERRIHQIIRGYTENILFEYNTNILKLLKDKNELLQQVSKVYQLRNHLIIWLGKYQSIFQNDKTYCLIYVGVEEKIPFPQGIEDEIEKLIHPELKTEDKSDNIKVDKEFLEEHSSSDWSFHDYLIQKNALLISLENILKSKNKQLIVEINNRDYVKEYFDFEREFAEHVVNYIGPGLTPKKEFDEAFNNLKAKTLVLKKVVLSNDLYKEVETYMIPIETEVNNSFSPWNTFIRVLPLISNLKFITLRNKELFDIVESIWQSIISAYYSFINNQEEYKSQKEKYTLGCKTI